MLHLGQNKPEQTYSMKQRGAGERVTLGTSEGEKDLGVLMNSELKSLSVWKSRSTWQTESLVSLDLISIILGEA